MAQSASLMTSTQAAILAFADIVKMAAAKLAPERPLDVRAFPSPSGVLRIELIDALQANRVLVDWGDSHTLMADRLRDTAAGRLVISEGKGKLAMVALKAAGAAAQMAMRDRRMVLLHFYNRDRDYFVCDDDAMDTIIAQRMAPEETQIAGFIFNSAYERTGPHYEWRLGDSRDRRITLTLSPPGLAQRVFRRIGPFDVTITIELPDSGEHILTDEDDEILNDDELKAAIYGACFLLSRSLHQDMKLEVPNAAAFNPDGPGGDINDPKPISATDFAPDVAWRRFFTPFEIERDAVCDFRFMDPTSMVQHGELECSFIQPIALSAVRFHRPLWNMDYSIGRENKGYNTFLDDNDLIMGESDKLDRLLARLRETESEGRMIFLNETCVSKIVGQDTAGIIRRHRKAGGKPVIYLDISLPSPMAVMGDVMRQMRELAVEDFGEEDLKEVNPLSVALIGYPADRSMEELRFLLQYWGVNDVTVMLPQSGVKLMWQALKSQVIVSSAQEDYRKITDTYFVRKGQAAVAPLAPYGIGATYKWIEEIIAAFGKPELLPLIQNARDESMAEFKDLYGDKIEGLGLGFVADRGEVARFSNPSKLFGIPLLGFLEEMGFGLNILLFTRNEEIDVPAVRELLDGTIADAASVEILPFQTREELAGLLTESRKFQAVYSQFSFDRRLFRSGKASFSMLDLEKGIEGAKRTAQRLIMRCRWIGPSRWGKAVRAAEWP